MLKLCRRTIIIPGICLWFGLAWPGIAQPPTPEMVTPTPVAIPEKVIPLTMPEIATQLVESRSMLADLRVRLQEDNGSSESSEITYQPVVLERQSTATLKLLGQHPTLQELKEAEEEWQQRDEELKAVIERLTATDKRRGSELEGLESQSNVWAATLSATQNEIPLPLRQSIESLRSELQTLQTEMNGARQALLLRLTHLAQSQSRVKNLLVTISQARSAKVKQVLTKDGRPLWAVDLAAELRQNVVGNLAVSLESEQKQLFAFGSANAERFLLHLFCFALFVTGLRWC